MLRGQGRSRGGQDRWGQRASNLLRHVLAKGGWAWAAGAGGAADGPRGGRVRGSGAAGTAGARSRRGRSGRSEEHTSELQSRGHLVCRLLLEKKKPPLHERRRSSPSRRGDGVPRRGRASG